MPLSADELEVRQRLKDDFSHYAPKCLRIRSKDGSIQPLFLNQAQRYIHERLEAQRQETGKVRAIILKGRQQGASTYIGGRFYWRITHRRGLRAFILTHEQAATDNLFGMANRYHEHCPAIVRPSTGAANAKELYFDKLDGGYEVGTAGTKAVGRSKTIQLFHGSEVAFWPHASSHFAAIIQAIPDLPNTEIILESTANGVGGEFHERWQMAETGQGDYQAIFVPWFWQDEYRKAVDILWVVGADAAVIRVRLHHNAGSRVNLLRRNAVFSGCVLFVDHLTGGFKVDLVRVGNLLGFFGHWYLHAWSDGLLMGQRYTFPSRCRILDFFL